MAEPAMANVIGAELACSIDKCQSFKDLKNFSTEDLCKAVLNYRDKIFEINSTYGNMNFKLSEMSEEILVLKDENRKIQNKLSRVIKSNEDLKSVNDNLVSENNKLIEKIVSIESNESKEEGRVHKKPKGRNGKLHSSNIENEVDYANHNIDLVTISNDTSSSDLNEMIMVDNSVPQRVINDVPNTSAQISDNLPSCIVNITNVPVNNITEDFSASTSHAKNTASVDSQDDNSVIMDCSVSIIDINSDPQQENSLKGLTSSSTNQDKVVSQTSGSSQKKNSLKGQSFSGFTTVQKPSNSIPPLTLLEVNNWENIRADLKKRLKGKMKAQTFGNELKLRFETSSDYRSTARYFEEKNLKHIVYDIDKEPLLRVVIKRVHENINLNHIKLELEDDHELTVQKITRLKKSGDSKYGSPLILVQLPNNPQNKKIYSITEIQGLEVVIDEFKNRRQVIQCYNCQQFHHGANSCRNETRCVKCSGPYRGSNCPKPKDKPPTCINCKGEHVSSYRLCPAFPKHPYGQINRIIHPPSGSTPNANSNQNKSNPTLQKQSFLTYTSKANVAPAPVTGLKKLYSQAVVGKTSGSNGNSQKLELLFQNMMQQQQLMMSTFQSFITEMNGRK